MIGNRGSNAILRLIPKILALHHTIAGVNGVARLHHDMENTQHVGVQKVPHLVSSQLSPGVPLCNLSSDLTSPTMPEISLAIINGEAFPNESSTTPVMKRNQGGGRI